MSFQITNPIQAFLKYQWLRSMISLVVAYSKNRVIGKNNDLPWYLPKDLKHFKDITTGKTVIMGRKTFDSIFTRLGKPLPNRRNIVLSRDKTLKLTGVEVFTSFDKLLDDTQNEDVYIIGGAELFKIALDKADIIYATEVNTVIDGDVYFPKLKPNKWLTKSKERHQSDEKNIHDISFITYERRS